MKVPTNELAIRAYLHCALCLEEIPDGVSPSAYKQLSVGWTVQGLQVWCDRHECNVLHVDFEGKVHPGNTTRKSLGEHKKAKAPGEAESEDNRLKSLTLHCEMDGIDLTDEMRRLEGTNGKK